MTIKQCDMCSSSTATITAVTDKTVRSSSIVTTQADNSFHQINCVAETDCTVSDKSLPQFQFGGNDGTSNHFSEIASENFRSVLLTNCSFQSEQQKIISKWNDNKKTASTIDGVLFVDGPSESGKTDLVIRTLRARTIAFDGRRNEAMVSGRYFVEAKFDFLNSLQPYHALDLAITDFVNQVLSRGDNEIELMQNAILGSMTQDEINIIVCMIPSLTDILDKGRSIATVNNQNSMLQRKFKSLFVKLMECICSVEKPITLFLDDIHWADPCSIDIIISIVNDWDFSDSRLLLVATNDTKNIFINNNNKNKSQTFYNDKKMEMSRIQERIGKLEFTLVSLDWLSKVEMEQVLEQAFFPEQGNGNKSVSLLTQIIHDHTCGKLTSTIFFLDALQQAGLINFDPTSNNWSIKNLELQPTEYFDCSISDLRSQHITTCLSSQSQDVMKVAACLAFQIDINLLSLILPNDPIELCLLEGHKQGFLTYSATSRSFSFVNNSIHQAFYSLVPIHQKPLFHLEIGRSLWKNLASDADLDSHIFVVLSQIRVGKELITDEHDRHALAKLCLHAGTRAATTASSFRIAAKCLSIGVDCLDKRSWRSHYDLCLGIYNAAAEMEMLSTNYVAVDPLIKTVLVSARRGEDKIQAFSTQIYSMGLEGKRTEAITVGLEVLRTLDERFLRHQCLRTGQLVLQMRRLNRKLRRSSDNEILNLPPMTDEKKLASMKIFQLLFTPTMRNDAKLFPCIVMRMLQYTLRYGGTVYSSIAFVGYGLVNQALGDVDLAYRLGMLGLQFLHRYKVPEYLPMVYSFVYSALFPWKKQAQDTLKPLVDGYYLGLQTGDIESAAMCSNFYLLHAELMGTPIPQLVHEFQKFNQTFGSSQQNNDIFIPVCVLLQALAGTLPPSALSDESLLTHGVNSQVFAGNKVIEELVAIRICQMIYYYLVGDYGEASKLAIFVGKHMWMMPPLPYSLANAKFYLGMIAVQMAAGKVQRNHNLKVAQTCIKDLGKYSSISLHNFLHYQNLLEGEYHAKINKNTKTALEKYTYAATHCQACGYKHIGYLSNLCITKFYLSQGMVDKAEPFYEQFKLLSRDWGVYAVTDIICDQLKTLKKIVKET